MQENKGVIIVGAGLAGLCCARTLQRAGFSSRIFEASDDVGGRVRTDLVEGFRLDRGFQVILTAYPALQQETDLSGLDLQLFEPGAILLQGEQRYLLGDPLRTPYRALQTGFFPLFGWKDKMKLARLRSLLGRTSIPAIFRMPDQTMEAMLRAMGFSSDFLNNFLRPFYGGIFLERELNTSARMFSFVFKMLATGQTALPANGMGALGQQIARGLQPGTLFLNSPVREILKEEGRAVGVLLERGEVIRGDAVVITTPVDVAARLTEMDLPFTYHQSTALYYALPKRLYRERMILLFPEQNTLINNAAMVSNVASSYAPLKQHLLAATVLGDPTLTDDALDARVRSDFEHHFPNAKTASWRLLRIYRVKQAQFAQPPGIFDHLPSPQTNLPGLALAGEITVSSSLHGALVSGQRAAARVMRWIEADRNR